MTSCQTFSPLCFPISSLSGVFTFYLFTVGTGSHQMLSCTIYCNKGISTSVMGQQVLILQMLSLCFEAYERRSVIFMLFFFWQGIFPKDK